MINVEGISCYIHIVDDGNDNNIEHNNSNNSATAKRRIFIKQLSYRAPIMPTHRNIYVNRVFAKSLVGTNLVGFRVVCLLQVDKNDP